MHIRSPAPSAYRPLAMESDTALRMAEAASTFRASLTPEQASRFSFPFESGERSAFDYLPRARPGLPLAELDGSQKKLAHALISSGLSRGGYAKALTIMSLETVLRELEGPSRRHPRDPDLYHFYLFGTPSDESPWGWRVEGHHLSLNFLILRGERIAPTPNFFGANPAQVLEGPLRGLRVLGAEEDLARELLSSLDQTQLPRAVVEEDAPSDIVTGTERRVRMDDPVGIAYSDMREEQRDRFLDLVREYTQRMPRDVAETRMDQIEKEGKGHLHFAWAGSLEHGMPHYYRIHGPSFLVEYDNTQNSANHIHTVWRDIIDDWGEDLLKDHYERSHRP
jgi:hypothetical protein